MEYTKPRRLAKGDTIAVVAPSSGLGSIYPHRVTNGCRAIENLGFRVKEYPTSRSYHQGSSGTAESRAMDLMRAFDDSSVGAIICTIGGLSCNEILPLLDFDVIRKNPKILCGYSDITLLHCACLRKADLVTFYGPAVMTQFAEYPAPHDYTVSHFLRAVTKTQPLGALGPSETWTDEVMNWEEREDLLRPRRMVPNLDGHQWLRRGLTRGRIVGGCSYSLLQMKGTEFDIDYEGKILLMETPAGQDFRRGLPLDYVDSELMDFRLAGIFNKISGLIVGRGFSYTTHEMVRLRDIVRKHVSPYHFPVLLNFNTGHTDPILTIPLGVMATLDGDNGIFSIDENGVGE